MKESSLEALSLEKGWAMMLNQTVSRTEHCLPDHLLFNLTEEPISPQHEDCMLHVLLCSYCFERLRERQKALLLKG